MQASYDAKQFPQDDNIRSPIHARYDKKPPHRVDNFRALIRGSCGAKLPHRGDKIRAMTRELPDETASSGWIKIRLIIQMSYDTKGPP